MSELVDILNEEQLETLLQSSLPVLVDFWAPWCGPCLAMTPSLSAAAKHYAGRVTFVKINIDELKETSFRYKIRSIPHCMLFHEGKILGTLTGLQPLQALLHFLAHHLKSL